MANATKTNPHPIHLSHTSSMEIRDAFLHVKWALERHGWTTPDFIGLLGIPRQTWYQYGHKLDSKGYRRIPAAQLDLLRQQHALASFGASDNSVDPFSRRRDYWMVGSEQSHSFMKAIYLAGITGQPILRGPENESQKAGAGDTVLRWFTAVRCATREQIVAATHLSDYDIGRLGFIGNHWGLEVTETQCERLETIVGGNKKAA